ncbi:P-loop containing nucleoside triphosphate hydrolase protein [Mycena latifolia]|nr:P-loop containing nucleoside triphosphate hydrolase protein [Mycena latifolia]
MPSQPSVIQVRLTNIIECLSVAVTTLERLSTSVHTPFLGVISTTIRSLLVSVQTIRQNKDACTRLMEQTHELLYPLIALHINSEMGGELTPTMLQNIGKFTETLHKIHVFVEAQQERSRIKQFFRHGEMTALLKDCNAGLQLALDAFKVEGVALVTDVADMQRNAQKIHQEVLELIASTSEGTSSDRASSINTFFSETDSSISLTMLPSEPKIFHGRGSELAAIIQAFQDETPRIAILGAGGMGKTSLARALLYHAYITGRYSQHRFFVACDSVFTPIELSGLIGSHLGLKPGKDLTRAVVSSFSSRPPSLLVLDNLETLWESKESRGAIEEFLSLLADIDHLALVITMRGAERPAKVRWTRPFLLPLKSLTPEAARQTFVDIAEDFHDSKAIDKLLDLTDNMPLAINLIAHLVDYEGCSNVLARWEEERTSLLSDGYDRKSNLDFSISLSLSSPRITALPHAQDLLSLLSLLPDGLSDVELLQSNLPIVDLFGCKTALLRTSLAYIDDQGRLKAMVPIREYMQKIHPPIAQIVHPLLQHFQKLMEVYKTYFGTPTSRGIVPRITLNFGNIQNMLMNGLHPNNVDLADTIYCALSLETFSRLTNHHCALLADQILRSLPQTSDHDLEVAVIIQRFDSWRLVSIPDPAALVEQGLQHIHHVKDLNLQCKF